MRDSEGKLVKFVRFSVVHYTKGERRKGNKPKPENLELLPVAIYAIRNEESKLKFARGTTPDYINPPIGAQRVYKTIYDDAPLRVFVYANSGVVSGWHHEKKDATH